MIKKFIPLLFIACGIVISMMDANAESYSSCKMRIEQKYFRLDENSNEEYKALLNEKKRANEPKCNECLNKPYGRETTITCNNFTGTCGADSTPQKCLPKNCWHLTCPACDTGPFFQEDVKQNFIKAKVEEECGTATQSNTGNEMTPSQDATPNSAGTKPTEKKETAKEKKAEHNQEYQEKQKARKLKAQIEKINKSADKLKLGDKLKWNASFNDDAGINAALTAWVDKCDTLATGNIAQTTVLGRESDGDYVCVIKTCKNGFNKSKSSTVCAASERAAEFADKFQELTDKFKSDVAAEWKKAQAK